MSLFPSINIENKPIENTLELYKEVAWDFEKDSPKLINGDILIVEGTEALKVWIYKALKTVRFTHEIYSWDYGNEMENLINKGFTNDLVIAETKRYVTEALMINEYILSVDLIEVNFKGDVLTVEVNVNTVYGEVSVNVQ